VFLSLLSVVAGSGGRGTRTAAVQWVWSMRRLLEVDDLVHSTLVAVTRVTTVLNNESAVALNWKVWILFVIRYCEISYP
jgi:membrane glycosyltransferase